MKSKHPRRAAVILLLVALLISAGAGLAQVSNNYDLHWNVLSNGGGERSSAHYRLGDTLGQGAFGETHSQNYRVDPGFWAGVPNLYRAYLPAVKR